MSTVVVKLPKQSNLSSHKEIEKLESTCTKDSDTVDKDVERVELDDYASDS